ncbi:MAG TPA: hypothetical protein VIP53_08695 [Nitrososphaera sp.]
MMELFYPLFLALKVRKMWMLNNYNRKMSLLRSIRLAATIFILTIIFASTSTLVSASTSSNTTTTTTNATSVREEQEAVSSTTTTTNNNSSAVLGNLFMIVEFETTSVNPINETYIETSTVNNVTIMPPNATTTGTTINAIETVNATINILPNGLALDKGQSLIVTEGDNGTAEEENATTTFVDISRMNPDGTGSGTGIVFFSTNSTGQLAFLNNMVGINDSEFSQGSGTIRVWEWKGGTLPFEIDDDGDAPTTENQTTITSALEVEE